VELDSRIATHEKFVPVSRVGTRKSLIKLQERDGVDEVIRFLNEPKVTSEKLHMFAEVALAHGMPTTRKALSCHKVTQPIHAFHASEILENGGEAKLQALLNHAQVTPENLERALYYYKSNACRMRPTMRSMRSEGLIPTRRSRFFGAMR
jgi:hypothetical protein